MSSALQRGDSEGQTPRVFTSVLVRPPNNVIGNCSIHYEGGGECIVIFVFLFQQDELLRENTRKGGSCLLKKRLNST